MLRFLSRIFSFLLRSDDPDERKRRALLRYIQGDIKKNAFHSFYRAVTVDVLPPFALFIYNFYITLYPMRSAFANAERSELFKEIVIINFIDEETAELIKKIQIDNLNTIAKNTSPEELVAQLNYAISFIQKKLNAQWMEKVDSAYRAICAFLWFITFDYYALLKKFDHELIENLPQIAPRFKKVSAHDVLDDIKDFLSVAEVFNTKNDWVRYLKIMSQYKETAMITIDQLQKIQQDLNAVLSSNILPLIIRHCESDPYWETKIVYPSERITEKYITAIINTASETARTITNNQKKKKIVVLLAAIFGQEEVGTVLRNCTEEENKEYISKGTQGIIYLDAYRYLMVFFDSYFEIIKEILDCLVIYGEWNNRGLSQKISSMLQEFRDDYIALTEFDKSLSVTGERGSKLKTYLSKASVGKPHKETLKKYLMRINDELSYLIKKQLIILKDIDEKFTDYRTKNNGIVSDIKNWSALEKILAEKQYDLPEIQHKINLFLALMKCEDFDISNIT